MHIQAVENSMNMTSWGVFSMIVVDFVDRKIIQSIQNDTAYVMFVLFSTACPYMHLDDF